MLRVFALLCLLIGGFVFAEDSESKEPTHVMTLEVQEISPFRMLSAEYADIDFVLAEEVFVGPKEINALIRDGHEMTSLYITLASKVNAKVKIVLSNTESVITNEKVEGYVLHQGVQQSINFVAFSPHSGTITILNEEDEVLAVIPYVVKQESQFRHSVNSSVSTNGSASLSYSLSSSYGWSLGTSLQLDADGNFSSSVNGSYSW